MRTCVITPACFFRVEGPWVEMLQKGGWRVVYPANPDPSSFADTIEALKDASAVIAGGEFFTEELLQKLPNLKVVARAGVGYDRVDVAACTRNGVVLTITPTANHECVAEHTVAILLALTRNLVGHHQDVLIGDWSRRIMQPLRGKTLGLVGLGRIGKSVAVRAAAFRLKIIAHEAFPDLAFVQKHGIELVDFPTLLKNSDYVSLHAPLNDATRHLINKNTLNQMKPGACLVNTARGGLVCEADLLSALQSGQLAGAGLDVFEQEPTPVSNPLLKLPNVVFTPHLAGGDVQSNSDMASECAQAILSLDKGEWPAAQVVNPDVRHHFKW